MPSSRIVFLRAAIFCAIVVRSVTGSSDVENSTGQQALVEERRRDLAERDIPLNGHDAKVLRKLISKRVIRLSKNKDSDEHNNRRLLPSENRNAAAPGMTTHRSNVNPFARAMNAGATIRYQRDLRTTRGGGSDDHIPVAPPTPDLIPMELVGFQDSRFVQPPVLVSPVASQFAPGTQYMYSNEPLYSVYLDSPKGSSSSETTGYMVDETDLVAQVSGTCIRTDPNDGNELYVGRAYCQYDYHFLDENGNVEAQFTAEGTVQIGPFSTLSITGGSGIFRRTVGTVILETGDIGFENTPIFVPNDALDLPSSYIVTAYVFMDSAALEGVEGIV